ncbi:MAG: hypothetical protein J5776_06780 [Clostridiales bacterium]|nr:hypothetical protein [Clostridiales bacterium]
MKGTTIRKAGAAVLAGAMALSCASCAIFGPNKKEIVEAADECASAIVKQDFGKLGKLADDDSADAIKSFAVDEVNDEIDAAISGSSNSDEQKEFIDAVADTITYEIDEESVEVDKDEASVDVVFTMVDYEKALKDDYSDIDEVLDLLDDCDDTKEVTVTFEFEKDDDEWLLTNANKKLLSKIFDFYTYELELQPDLISLMSSAEIYGGSYYVDVYVYFSEDISDFDGSVTFDVYFEGQQIASDMAAYVFDYYIWCEYYDEDYDYLDSGEYTVVIKCNGEEIASESTSVDNSWAETEAFNGDLSSAVSSTDWWLDNGDDTYDVGVEKIEFDVYFTTTISNYDITFDVYDEDGNAIEMYLEPEIYSTSVYCIYDPGYELDAGVYNIQVYDSPETSANMIASGYCEIK